MNRIRSLAVVGLAGVVVLGCKDKDIEPPKQDVADLQYEQGLRDYLAEGGELNKYLIDLAKAVCELEKKTTGIPDATRICPKDPPHDIKPPPPYPPR